MGCGGGGQADAFLFTILYFLSLRLAALVSLRRHTFLVLSLKASKKCASEGLRPLTTPF